MAKYILTSPEGEKFKVTAPDDATESQVMEYFQSQREGIESAIPAMQAEREKKEQYLEENWPAIAGDITLTALAPQYKAATKLPFMVKPALNLLSRMGASSIGSGGGSMLGDVLRGEPVDVSKAEQEALLGAGGELLTTTGGAGLKLAKDKFARPTINALADFTRVGSTATRQAAKSLNRTRQEFIGKTTDNALDFMRSLGGTTKQEAGMQVGEALAKKTDWSEVYKRPNKIIEVIGKKTKGEIPFEDAQLIWQKKVSSYMQEVDQFGRRIKNEEAVDKAIQWAGFAKNSKEARLLREFYREDTLRPQDANYLIKKLWKSYGDDPKQVVEFKESLKTAFVDDVQRVAGGDINFADALGAADRVYAETNRWFRENPTAKALIDKMQFGRAERRYFEEFPERVIDRLVRSSPEQIASIRKEILKQPGGESAWAGLEMSFVRDLYNKAISENADTAMMQVHPATLVKNIREAKGAIKAINPDLWKTLDKQAKYYEEIAPKFARIDVSNGMDIFEAWGALSPRSKKFVDLLGKGVGKATKYGIKAGIHIGGRPVFDQEGSTP